MATSGYKVQDENIQRWLEEHPNIYGKFKRLPDADKPQYISLLQQKGTKAAKTFLNRALNVLGNDPDKLVTEVADGVYIPTASRYPTPSLIFGNYDPKTGEYTTDIEDHLLEGADYDKVGPIDGAQASTVGGVGVPSYNPTKSIGGASLQRVNPVGQPNYQGAGGIGSYGAAGSEYSMTDPMAFAEGYGEFYRGEALKNLNLADQMALTQLNTELGGLIDYAQGAAALKRQETSIDNLFNQQQRIDQVRHAVPGVVSDLEGQRDRANAYAEGRLPDEMEDRMMELNTRSRSADTSAASGIGAGSAAGQKASTLMSAEQRMGVSQYGDQLLSQNVQARKDLLLAPTEYISAGQQISVMPSQSASVLSSMNLGQLNANANISATNALGSKVSQEQFSANLSNNISQFNAAMKQDTDKFNTTMEENQAQFQANMQTQIDEFNASMAASENLNEAQIQQRTEEFNANMQTQQSQFQASQEQAISTFNAQMAVNQNQFNATIAQRTQEFNATSETQQNQFVTSLAQRVAEYNTTLEYNTETSNKGILNAFSLGKFDYNVTYKGMVAGALNKKEDQLFSLRMAEMELSYYEDALNLQLDFEREKLEAQLEALDEGPNSGATDGIDPENLEDETKDPDQEDEG